MRSSSPLNKPSMFHCAFETLSCRVGAVFRTCAIKNTKTNLITSKFWATPLLHHFERSSSHNDQWFSNEYPSYRTNASSIYDLIFSQFTINLPYPFLHTVSSLFSPRSSSLSIRCWLNRPRGNKERRFFWNEYRLMTTVLLRTLAKTPTVHTFWVP